MPKVHRSILAIASCLIMGGASCTTPSTGTNTATANTSPGSSNRGQSIAKEGDSGNPEVGWKTAVKPKELSDNVIRGLEWLVGHQLENGGWGQGDESQHMRGSNEAHLRDTANVADTSVAIMTFLRSGSTPSKGTYKDVIYRGLHYILSQIEESDEDSLYITSVRGTRVQAKIGTYVDTFTALIVLTEAKGKMPSAAENQRLEKALNKVLAKIEKNQRTDGTWDNRGWAPVLSQSMAAKGLNRAAQAGAVVRDSTLARVEAQARKQFDAKSGSFGGDGSAGIELYSGAASSASMRESVTTRKTKARALRRKAARAPSSEATAAADREVKAAEEAEMAAQTAEKALTRRLEDPNFIAGFGNNGGEEFLSYMLVSESLVVKGGDEWTNWDARITNLINGVQNGDGSWTGHHCITGRTFCTAAALLVLMADRTPVPAGAQIAG